LLDHARNVGIVTGVSTGMGDANDITRRLIDGSGRLVWTVLGCLAHPPSLAHGRRAVPRSGVSTQPHNTFGEIDPFVEAVEMLLTA
jgi:hypothetical protein